ncbi:MAG: SpoIIE family protein phosphatase [Acidobacteriia bacterium]|nr:SpoIIE family protein phosphatase [Terriglobia bacterium]
MDRIALAILAVYVAYRIARSAGAVLPFSTLVGLLGFAALAYFVVRLVPWFRMRVLWSLRNRLIAAYVFMAVVPVMLLMIMIGLGFYLFYLQLGAHLLQDAVQAHVNTIRADADTIAGAIERETAPSATPVGPGVLNSSTIAGLVSGEQANWPGLTVSVNRGQPLLATSGGQRYAGLVEYQGRLSFVSAQRRSVPAGPFTVLVIAPLTPALLDEFPEVLGPIQLILMEPAGGSTTGRLALDIDGHLYATGEQIASTRRSLPPPTSWLDVRFQGGSTFKVFHVEPGKDEPEAPVLASFWVRPLTINGNLFKSVGALGPYLIVGIIVAAAIFLVLEVAVLATGWLLTRTITRSIADLYDGTLHVRRGDFSHRVRVTQRDQLGALGESFNEMTSSISELIEEQRERQRLENEVSIAREVQQQLFPHTLPSVPGLELGAICRPARVVSGDYYDFISLGPTRVGIALADISGKGIFASLLMASLQAALRSAATLDAQSGTAEIVSRVNRHLFSNTSDDRYATLFYAVYDSREKTLTYTNAGHLPPFFLTDGRVEKLDQGGTVVGLFDDARYAECTRKVEPGSLLVAFSDGLTEPESVYGEEFGIERLKAEVVRRRGAQATQLAEGLIAATEQWAGTPEQADDVTVVVARMGL